MCGGDISTCAFKRAIIKSGGGGKHVLSKMELLSTLGYVPLGFTQQIDVKCIQVYTYAKQTWEWAS